MKKQLFLLLSLGLAASQGIVTASSDHNNDAKKAVLKEKIRLNSMIEHVCSMSIYNTAISVLMSGAALYLTACEKDANKWMPSIINEFLHNNGLLCGCSVAASTTVLAYSIKYANKAFNDCKEAREELDSIEEEEKTAD